MDELKTVTICPLGSKCREIKNGEIHQCAWFVKLAGTNPQTGEQIDEYGCSMAWLPVLLIENANTNRSTAAAVESFRNEATNQAINTNNILIAAAQGRGLINGDNFIQ